MEHRGGDTSVCTGIVDRKCDPVAICERAVDNVKGGGGTGTGRVRTWRDRWDRGRFDFCFCNWRSHGEKGRNKKGGGGDHKSGT